ncbi:MAG: archaetidylserine decarboxylase [Halieaceae bacterium]|nr:archaetidylserine decarboxylase [Halieaceae bacterium]
MDQLFILLQHLAPQHLLSRCVGWLARSEISWIKGPFIRLFASHFEVNMSEAAEPDLEAYANFNAFFTRALAEGARPLATGEDAVLCPADGSVSQLGSIDNGRIFQAKGHSFTCSELLGDSDRAKEFDGGSFATVYLSPRDYHRVHMPVAGELSAQTYIPGALFSVNQVTAANVDRLFARNERLVCYFDTDHGPMAMVLVGAMIVAGIQTVWSGQVAPPPREPHTVNYKHAPGGIALTRGEEMGRFMLGSTVILLFPKNTVEWEPKFTAESPTRMGERLGTLTLS